MTEEELPLALAAAFGPILKEGFPGTSSFHRMAVGEALADVVLARRNWFDQNAASERLVAAFVATLTDNGRNGDRCLSVDHDALSDLVKRARQVACDTAILTQPTVISCERIGL